MAIWSVGVWILSSSKFRLSGLLNPPIVAIILAVLVREIGGVNLIPPFLWEIISVLSSCAIPVGLLLIGGNFADLLRNFKLSEVKIEFSAIMVRLFLLPLLFFRCNLLSNSEGMDWLKKNSYYPRFNASWNLCISDCKTLRARRHSCFTMHFGIYGSLFNDNPYMVVLGGETLSLTT